MGSQCCLSVVQQKKSGVEGSPKRASIVPKSPISPVTDTCRGSNDDSQLNPPGFAQRTQQTNITSISPKTTKVQIDNQFNNIKQDAETEQQEDPQSKFQFDTDKVQTLRCINKIEDYYDVGKVIGNGSYGQVVQAKHIKLGIACAIKIISKEKMSSSKLRKDRMVNELRILEKIMHQHVVRIYELMHDKTNFYVVSELVNSGDMAKLMCQRQKEQRGLLSERDVRFIARQLFSSVNYLHRMNIAHRDIKLDNILIDEKTGIIKLTDFGFAQAIPKHKGFLTQRLGSTRYVAPEILMKRPYDCKVDVWSATVVIYVLLSGRMPFNGKDFPDMKRLLEKHDVDLSPSKVGNISPEARSFLRAGLDKNRHNRATSQEMLDHPWLHDAQVAKQIHYKTNNAAQSIFMLRSGHLIAQQHLNQLLDCLVKHNVEESPELTKFTELQDTYGTAGLNHLIRDYLRNMDSDAFHTLVNQVLCDTKLTSESLKPVKKRKVRKQSMSKENEQ